MVNSKRKLVSVVLMLICVIIVIIMAVISAKNQKNEENALKKDNKNTVQIINYETSENGVIENNSRKIKVDQVVKNLVVSNTKIVFENGKSKYTADILNRGRDNSDLKIKLKFMGNNSNVLAEKEIDVGKIKEKETKNISTELQEEVINTSYIVYEIL